MRISSSKNRQRLLCFPIPIPELFLHKSYFIVLEFDGINPRSQAAYVKLNLVTFIQRHTTCHVENAYDSSIHDAAVFILPALFGVDGIWFAILCAEVLSLVLSIAMLKKYKERYHYA